MNNFLEIVIWKDAEIQVCPLVLADCWLDSAFFGDSAEQDSI